MSATLTDNEMASLAKVAQLRGHCGKLRNAIRKAHRILLQHEHATPMPGYPIEALNVLSAALDLRFKDDDE